jgi:hypothetical protein
LTWSVWLKVAVPKLADTVALAVAETMVVVMVKVADVDPAGIVMLSGTEAVPARLLVSVTTAPPVGAGPFSVTVPVTVPPPKTDAVAIVNAESTEGRTVRLCVLEALNRETVMAPTCTVATADVVTVKVVEVAPVATATEDGTTIEVLLLATAIEVPAGAAELSDSVPVT